MKQYHVFNAQAKQAEAKLRTTESLRQKVEQQASKASKKLKQIEKQREKVCFFFVQVLGTLLHYLKQSPEEICVLDTPLHYLKQSPEEIMCM